MINAYESASYLQDQYLWVAVIVFLFMIRLRFPKSKSISVILRRRYGQSTLKRLQKFEKLIIVYVKLYRIYNFYYGIETAMSYLSFWIFVLVVVLWKLL